MKQSESPRRGRHRHPEGLRRRYGEPKPWDPPSVHEHHDNHHEHHEPKHEPVVSKRWHAAAVLGNLMVGVAEIATGWGNTWTVLVDGAHNGGDAGTFNSQANDARKKTAKITQLRKKITYNVICGSSLMVPGVGIAQISRGIENEGPSHSILPATASLALSGLLYYRLRHKTNEAHQNLDEPCHGEDELRKHLTHADIPSALTAVAGTIFHHYDMPAVDVALATIVGGFTAFHYRPTTANLNQHDH